MSRYAYLQLPGRNEVPRMSAKGALKRMQSELCIPVEEDYGYQDLFWFPGMSASATAHWWVTAGGPCLVGELYGMHDVESDALFGKLVDTPRGLYVHGDMDSNSFMVLPAGFGMSLVPGVFADSASTGDCNLLRNPSGEEDQCFARLADAGLLRQLWDLSRWIARHSHPEEFLARLWLACDSVAGSPENQAETEQLHQDAEDE